MASPLSGIGVLYPYINGACFAGPELVCAIIVAEQIECDCVVVE